MSDPNIELDTDLSRSTVGQTHEDRLSATQGTDVCFSCGERMTPAEIGECERREECRGGGR